jgi:prepilin-type N-terminal cleavage/methylation domain-containing protein
MRPVLRSRTILDHGFTIIELMMVVVIIGILAAVAVYAYSKTTRKAKSSEVPAMFAEFKTKEESFAAERGRYLGACPAAMPLSYPETGCVEGDYWPTPLTTITQMDVTLPPPRWSALRIAPGKGALYCQYAVVAGPGGDNSNMGPIGQMLFGEYPGSTPPKNWFYMQAQCDFDNDMAANAEYWQRGDLTTIGDNGNTAR